MRVFVAVTDNDWFRFLRSRPDLDEVNFWQPSGSSQFRALDPGEPFLFKLHSPDNFVVGGGFFAHFSLLPHPLAWDFFEEKNGAAIFLLYLEQETGISLERAVRAKLEENARKYPVEKARGSAEKWTALGQEGETIK